jgi:hypothetical protein
MTQTFELLVVDIKESIEQCSSPSQLTSLLRDSLKKAEEFEEEWINELYESDCFDAYIY